MAKRRTTLTDRVNTLEIKVESLEPKITTRTSKRTDWCPQCGKPITDDNPACCASCGYDTSSSSHEYDDELESESSDWDGSLYHGSRGCGCVTAIFLLASPLAVLLGVFC